MPKLRSVAFLVLALLSGGRAARAQQPPAAPNWLDPPPGTGSEASPVVPAPGTAPAPATGTAPAPAPAPGSPAELLARLDSSDPAVRQDALRAIAESADPEAIPRVGRVLTTDPSEEVRRFAVIALLRIGTPAAVPWLQQAAGQDGSPRVREAAAAALERLGSPVTATPATAAAPPSATVALTAPPPAPPPPDPRALVEGDFATARTVRIGGSCTVDWDQRGLKWDDYGTSRQADYTSLSVGLGPVFSFFPLRSLEVGLELDFDYATLDMPADWQLYESASGKDVGFTGLAFVAGHLPLTRQIFLAGALLLGGGVRYMDFPGSADFLRYGFAVGPKLAFEYAAGHFFLELFVRYLYRYEFGDVGDYSPTSSDQGVRFGLGLGAYF